VVPVVAAVLILLVPTRRPSEDPEHPDKETRAEMVVIIDRVVVPVAAALRNPALMAILIIQESAETAVMVFSHRSQEQVRTTAAAELEPLISQEVHL
jgi:hypothetical protein